MRTHIRVILSCAVLSLVASSCEGLGGPGCGPPPPEVARDAVMADVFRSDTVLTYADGVTRFGALFGDQHRLAVGWDQIPAPWIVSIVAAEDGRFWHHSGVDAESVARAARDNAQAGTVVSGGSTLTQQTAKNLFDRPDRSIDAKLQELDYALHLEKTYTKHELLTFYANLFHVTGNGTGLGVAARYFFDKEPKDLGLLECAYLAGLVKGPANYDPFPGDEAQRAEAKKRAHERTRYVLERILAEPKENLVPVAGEGRVVTEAEVDKIRAEAQKLLDKGFELPFRKGTFRYDSSILVDEVDRRLRSAPFTQVLAANGITDPKSAGLTVVTTLDPVAQHEATYGLWHQLAELGVMLEGLDAAAFVLKDASPPAVDPTRPPTRHQFRNAKITGHSDGGLDADLGGFPCRIDRDAVVRAASAVYRGKKQDRYAKTPTADVDAFAAAIKDGSVVYVSVKDAPAKGTALCDLEARPELQGAAVVVEDGQLRAMVGGSTNQDFNRALAPRQMGSTFKPLIYHAAMTLGWQPDDIIDNRPNVFPFSGTFYAPSADHTPQPWVSLGWAGVNSENLASVWLLYHLTDLLGPAQTERIARMVGLARTDDESEDDYQKRIQEAGVLPTKGRVVESHFFHAKQEVVAALIADGKDQEAQHLRSLVYGWGFDGQKGDARALSNTYKHLQSIAGKCRTQYETFDRALRDDTVPSGISDLSVRQGEDGLEVACGTRPEGFTDAASALRSGTVSRGGEDTPAAEQPEPATPTPVEVVEPIEGKRGKGKAGKAGKAGKHPSRPDPVAAEPEPDEVKVPGKAPKDDGLLLDDRITLGTLEALEGAIERQKLVWEAGDQDLYAPEVLYAHSDFRTLLGMKYVTHLAARYGVRTDLLEVMSLPLGASEITIEEAARLYDGIVSGESWTPTAPSGGLTDGPTILIAEIRDREGKVLYKADPQPVRVANKGTGQLTADILRNVVQYGTGKSAKDAAESGGALVPIGGKTGTTNDFKNVAFLGYLPGPGASGYSAADGQTIGVYVGYDDNRSMKEGKISVSGAVGALPAWITTLQGLHRVNPGEGIAGVTPENGIWPLEHNPQLVYEAVSTVNGIPLAEAPEGEVATARVLTRSVRAEPESPEEPVASRPGEGPRRPAGRKKGWWQIW